jgi:MFS family permease
MIRDRLTWLAYALLGWFAYLQASPGLVVGHLRDELGLGYAAGGLYVAAFALGSTVGGLLAAPLERTVGRRRLVGGSAALMALGAGGLTAGSTVATTLGAVLLMGTGGGLLLSALQALLSDHHEEQRTVALAEANVAASLGYLTLIGALSLAAAIGVGWRVALVVSLVVPGWVWWTGRGVRVDGPPARPDEDTGRGLPSGFRVAAAILVCTTAVEWSVTAWGASFVEESAGTSADAAVALMAGYFGGFLAGRLVGSRLAAGMDPARLLGGALATATAGFVVLWPAGSAVQAAAGLVLLGLGVGNFFPMALSLAVGSAPGRTGQASGRAVAASAGAVLLAPVTIGALADVTSLRTALLVLPVLLALSLVALRMLVRAGAAAARGSSR